MKKIKYLIPIYFLLIIGCATKQTTPTTLTQKIHPLDTFFTTYQEELKSTVTFLEKEKMIMSLTHLRRMAGGGKKYYLLEKENISTMIRQLTTVTYSDCYLINKSGTIVYAMNNDDYFGVQVNKGILGEALKKCFLAATNKEFNIEDLDFEESNPTQKLFISMPIKSNQQITGLIVLVIDFNVLAQVYPEQTSIIANDQIIRYSTNYPAFTKYPKEKLSKNNFQKYNLNWQIITEK